MSDESKHLLAGKGPRQIVQSLRWSVAMEIPLNRGHICFVLSQSILRGIRAKENDANYAFRRLVSSCVECQSHYKQEISRGYRCGCCVGVYQRCWLAEPLMTNQDMRYVFPNNSSTSFPGCSLHGQVFQVVSVFYSVLLQGSWLSAVIFFFAVNRYFGRLLIFSLPPPKINQSNCWSWDRSEAFWVEARFQYGCDVL